MRPKRLDIQSIMVIVLSFTLGTMALGAVLWAIFAGVGLTSDIREVRRFSESNRQFSRQVKTLAENNKDLIVQVAHLREKQVHDLSDATRRECLRNNRLNAALVRIFRTITRSIRRFGRYRGSALRTYKRALLRLSPLPCPKVKPSEIPPVLTPSPQDGP